jgi:hypothetical protein
MGRFFSVATVTYREIVPHYKCSLLAPPVPLVPEPPKQDTLHVGVAKEGAESCLVVVCLAFSSAA